MAQETKQFQTEVKEILNIMVHSLYSQREIFLRELVSNASDALDKRRFEEISHPEWASEEEKHIRLVPDAEKKTLTIQDNGIGMGYDEVVQNIGTIAYSGTKNFLQKAQELKDKPELIGQFGVGFYSAFMVAEKVELHTQKMGEADGTLWQSSGDGAYTIEHKPRFEGAGTTITLHLKEFKEDDESAQDFTDEWVLKSLVRKYSDFISYPVMMRTTKEEAKKDAEGNEIPEQFEQVTQDETLNSRKALWLKPAKEITEEEYKEFYRHLTHDWNEPFETIHYKAEGTQEFNVLLYIPSVKPFDYNQREMKYGLNLYVKKVFIKGDCEELIPVYLRFLKGVVDSSDLSLNVSREMLQKDKQIHVIRKNIVNKILKSLKAMLEKDRSRYGKFWENFGATLKEGIPSDWDNKAALQDLLLFHSGSQDTMTTLKEYVARMPVGQKAIYYMTGESIANISTSPYLEKLKEKNYEVLYLIDPIDEWVMNTLTEAEGKPLTCITKENLDLYSEDERKDKENALKEQVEKFKPLTSIIQDALAEHIKEVKITDRLVDSPVCLVSAASDPSAHMERVLESVGQKRPKSKRILEMNPKHPIFDKMLALNEDKKKAWSEILYNQALISEGSPIKDPMRFSQQISQLMLEL